MSPIAVAAAAAASSPTIQRTLAAEVDVGPGTYRTVVPNTQQPPWRGLIVWLRSIVNAGTLSLQVEWLVEGVTTGPHYVVLAAAGVAFQQFIYIAPGVEAPLFGTTNLFASLPVPAFPQVRVDAVGAGLYSFNYGYDAIP